MMDEAESLCHKIAIQVNGRFACIGTPQNLKQKYGSGYRATLLLNDLDAKVEIVFVKLVNSPRTGRKRVPNNSVIV
jgi:ABC-type multidrug transport system ATPase subunit